MLRGAWAASVRAVRFLPLVWAALWRNRTAGTAGYWVVYLASVACMIRVFFILQGQLLFNPALRPLSHRLHGLMVFTLTFGLAPVAGGPAVRILPGSWFQVPAGERCLHRLLGVGIFAWMLERSGYNRRVIRNIRGFDGTRTGLPSLALSLRAAAASHILCFAPHFLLATVALLISHSWDAAVWILGPGVVFHAYPVLLQRSLLLRVQPLLERHTPRTARLPAPDAA